MFHTREILGFRLGKLIRIPAIEVERIECQQSLPQNPMKSSNAEESSPSPLVEEPLAADIRLARMIRG